MAAASEPPDSPPSPPAASPEAPAGLPLLFGRYQVEQELGRGGMGRVLLAFDTKLRIHVAVKMVPDALMADPEAAEDLRREVLRGIALMHPGIVRTHTFEHDESGAAIVMEYIDGLTFTAFKEQMPGRCFDAEELLPWLGPLCEVLDYAHREARIVHRDLKPRNIMVSREGRLKVADFGISATLTDSLSRNTREGSLSGTPAYMSPQQARGKKPSHLDDIYSLGATIYDLLSGKPPFFRGSMDTILMQVACEPPPLMRERREELDITGKAPIPEHWEQTIAACLAKEPGDRPQSCGEVLARLNGWAPATPALAAPAGALVPVPRPKLVRAASPRTVDFPSATPHVITGSLVQPKRRKAWLVPVLIATALVAVVIAYVGKTKAPTTSGAFRGERSAPAPSPAPPDPASATKEAPFVNSLGMKFVPVPGTDVLMCVHETRRRDYAAYANSVGGVDETWKRPVIKSNPLEQEEDHPVIQVSWNDAASFCSWLSQKEGRQYRLPSEREWSLAVAVNLKDPAAVTDQQLESILKGQFPWGASDIAEVFRYGNYDHSPDGFSGSAPVMSFRPNHLGIYDLGGNAWEWCDGWADDAKTQHPLRGCGFLNHNDPYIRANSRQPTEAGFRVAPNNDFWQRIPGFRCVLAPAEQAAKPPVVSLPAATPSPTTIRVIATPPAAATPKPLSEIDKWLAQVEAIYQPKWQSEVVEPYESGWDGLKKMILSALDLQIAAASRAAKLQEAIVYRNERERIDTDKGLPADDSDSPPAALKTLRATWRSQAATLEADRRQHAQTLFGQYDQVLATNQAALTQRQRFDDALQLQRRRDALKKEWLAPPPKPGTPAAATKERPFINSLGMKFVPVPITGGPTSGQRVLFSIWETRVQDFEAFVAETKRMWTKPDFEQGPMHPVAGVNWNESKAFCAWLTARDRMAGTIGGSDTYRLPSDHEWSCAVGIGDGEDAAKAPAENDRRLDGVFPWGNELPPPKGAGNFAGEELQDPSHRERAHAGSNIISNYRDAFEYTAPVGSFTANKFGLFDLSGNVWEWCEDWYDSAAQNRVTRGGGWDNRGGDSRGSLLLSSQRRSHPPLHGMWAFVGFRCVLVSSTVADATETQPDRVGVSMPAGGLAPSALPHAPASATTPAPFLPPAASNRTDAVLAKATKDAPFVNSLGMKFVPVPGTKVLFCIHETRRQDYAAYAAEVPGVNGSWKISRRDGNPAGHEENHPVVSVSWEDATAFCAWLSKKEAKTYRLPTDHEWSYAVGIAHREKWTKGDMPETRSDKLRNEYPWGGDFPPKTRDRVGNYADTAWHEKFPSDPYFEGYSDGFPTTAPVMSFKPNKLGLYDMGGNVWEWIEDWWNADAQSHVIRGSSFRRTAGRQDSLLSSSRMSLPPNYRESDDGFRCVVELP